MYMRLLRIITVFIKDLKDATRDARVIVALIVPLGIGAFYGYALDDDELSRIDVDVAITIASPSRIQEQIEKSLPTNIHPNFTYFESETEVERDIRNGDSDIGLVVPSGFDADVEAGRTPTLTVIRSPDTSVAGDYILSALNPVLREMAGQANPVEIVIINTEQGNDDSVAEILGVRTWSLVASIAIMLGLVAMLAVPIVLTEEIEKKTIDVLVLAMPYGEVVAGKALLGMFYFTVMTAIFTVLTGLDVQNWPLFVSATALTGLALLGLGLLMAGIFKNANQLNTWSGLVLTPVIAPAFIVGQPVPDLLRQAASLFPSGAGTKLLLDSVARERLFDDWSLSFAVLVIWIVASFLLLIWQLKRRQA